MQNKQITLRKDQLHPIVRDLLSIQKPTVLLAGPPASPLVFLANEHGEIYATRGPVPYIDLLTFDAGNVDVFNTLVMLGNAQRKEATPGRLREILGWHGRVFPGESSRTLKAYVDRVAPVDGLPNVDSVTMPVPPKLSAGSVLIKVRTDTGNLMVYDCQPNQLSCSEHVRKYGKPVFIKSHDQWSPAGVAGRVDPNSDQHLALEAMPIDFDDIPGVSWSLKMNDEDAAGGTRYTSIASAIHARDALFPDVKAGLVKLARNDAPASEIKPKHKASL